jgi:hypothetical protein
VPGTRLRPGNRVVLAKRLKRGRRHKLGRARVAKGTPGVVVQRRKKLFKDARYDVQFRRQRDERGQPKVTPKVPREQLRRRPHPARVAAAAVGAVVVLVMVVAVVDAVSSA